VDERERLPVHRPGEQDLGATRLVQWDRATKTLGGLGLKAAVRPFEPDVRGPAQRTREREHVSEGDAGPSRGTSGTRTPRCFARNVADGDEAGTLVARALQRRGHLALTECLTQRGEGKAQLALDGSVHLKAPGSGVDLRRRGMPAHVEGVRGGQRTLRERGKPGLGVERFPLMHDHVRALSVSDHAKSVRASRARSSRAGKPPVGHRGRFDRGDGEVRANLVQITPDVAV
jgi:hypothetical protein